MIATSHVIIGGAVGIAVGTVTHDPAAALIAGFVAHLVCDAIPHLDGPLEPQLMNGRHDEIVWTPGFTIFAISDSIIAFLLTLGIWYYKFHLSFSSMYAWGAFGGYLPDFIDLFPLWRFWVRSLPFFKQFHKFHIWVHETWMYKLPMKKYWPLGVVTQVIIVLPCLYYLIK